LESKGRVSLMGKASRHVGEERGIEGPRKGEFSSMGRSCFLFAWIGTSFKKSGGEEDYVGELRKLLKGKNEKRPRGMMERLLFL